MTGDRIQLQQVVLNLLRNAVEAIVQRPGLIEVRIAAVADGVRLAVSDSGNGIPAQLLDQIFSPFFTTKDSGLGMGLSISRTIIETHGGRLWAEANPERRRDLRVHAAVSAAGLKPRITRIA